MSYSANGHQVQCEDLGFGCRMRPAPLSKTTLQIRVSLNLSTSCRTPSATSMSMYTDTPFARHSTNSSAYLRPGLRERKDLKSSRLGGLLPTSRYTMRGATISTASGGGHPAGKGSRYSKAFPILIADAPCRQTGGRLGIGSMPIGVRAAFGQRLIERLGDACGHAAVASAGQMGIRPRVVKAGVLFGENAQ